jgi:exopolysaccharide biosynthesis protein
VETNLNEARMTVGLTADDRFFISVIDGRANNRTGATHVETVAWIQEYFEKQNTQIRYALDLDSASSVSLGVFRDGEFQLLNQTARGSDSKLYDTRYYNHLGYLCKVPE